LTTGAAAVIRVTDGCSDSFSRRPTSTAVNPTSIYLSSPIKPHAEPADKRLVIDPYLTSEIFGRPNEKREFVGLAAGSEMRGAGNLTRGRPLLQMRLLNFSTTITRWPLSRPSAFRQGQRT
jgi:hypothetical protein